MLKNYIRVLLGTQAQVANEDLSDTLQEQNGVGKDLTLGGGITARTFYIGQHFPFNNFYALLDFGGARESGESDTTSNVLKVEYWSSTGWRQVVDITDGTKGLTKAGGVQFVPHQQYSWDRIDDTSLVNSSHPTDLNGVTIYNLYWIRVSLSAGEIIDDTIIKKLTYAFCDSADLAGHEPQIDNYLNVWGGPEKVDWMDQIFKASEKVVIDLKQKGLIVHPGQILLFDDVSMATQYMSMILISRPLGDSFENKRLDWGNDYTHALNIKRFSVDVNKTGALEASEYALKVGVLER